MSERRRTIFTCALGLLVLFFATMVRLEPAQRGLPYIGYVDEGHVLQQVVWTVRTGSWDLGWYLYPSLPIYLNAAAVLAYAPVYEAQHGHPLTADLPEVKSAKPSLKKKAEFYNLISPPELIYVSRVVTVFFSVATVAAAWLLAWGLAGRQAGLLAALLVACCPALLSRSHIVIVDTFATFFAVAALLPTLRLAQNPALSKAGWRTLGLTNHDLFCLAAGVLAGLAFASKYPVGAVVVAAGVCVLLSQQPWSRKLRHVGLLALGLGGGMFLGMPSLFLRFSAVLQDQKAQLGMYAAHQKGLTYLDSLVSRREVGWWVFALGLAGLGLALGRKELRTFALGCIAFAVVMLAPLLLQHFQPFRNILPLLPLLAIFSAIAAVEAASRAAALLLPVSALRPWLSCSLGCLLVGLAMFWSSWFSAPYPPTSLAAVQSRTQLVDWAATHIGPADRTLVLQELSIPPSELRRIPGTVRQSRWPDFANELSRAHYDHVLISNLRPAPRTASGKGAEVLSSLLARVQILPVEERFGSRDMVAASTLFIAPNTQVCARRVVP